jgi:hypothetical protein
LLKEIMATFFENLWGSIFTPGATPTLLIATNVTFAALQITLAGLLALTYSIHFVALSAICGGLWWAINWFAAEIAQAEKAEQEAGRLRKRRTGLMDEKRDRDRDTTDYGDESTDTEVEGKNVGGVQIRGGPSKIQAVIDSANSTDEDFEGSRGVQTRGGPGKAQAVMDSAGTAHEQSLPHLSQVRIRGGPQKILGVMQSAKDAQVERDAAASGFQPPQVRGGPSKILGVLGMSQEEFEAKNSPDASGSQDTNKGETGSVSTDSEWEKVSDR